MTQDSGCLDSDVAEEDVFTCPNCGAVLGRLYEVRGLDLVQIGPCLHRSINAICVNCGRPFYYHFSDKTLEKAVRKTKR